MMKLRPSRTRMRFFSRHQWMGVWLTVLLSVNATGQAQVESLDGGLQTQLQEVVEQLEKEAGELEDLKDPKMQPVFSRPHPLIRGWDFSQMGPVVLQRMTQRFEGDRYRDTYVRWHLMYAVTKSLEAKFVQWKDGGEHDVHERTGKRLVRLIGKMPGEIATKSRPEYRHEPPEIAHKYHALNSSTRIRVGIPPFVRDYYGAAALPYASGERKAQIEAAIKEMETLRGKFKTITDPKAIAFNRRLGKMRLIMREYRGELVYAMLQTGDSAMIKLVVAEISRQIGDKQRIGLDLMRYLYTAMYDGYLLLYDSSDYKMLRNALKQAAQGADARVTYLRGKNPPPSWFVPQHNNFADMAFHLVQILDFSVVLNQFRYTERADWRKRDTGNIQRPVNGTTLKLSDIRTSINHALDELYAPRAQNTDVLPVYQLRGESELYASIRNGINSPRYQEIVHETGNQAIITWAMLSAGESFQNPQLYRRLSFVLASDTPFTFDRAMRMQMLSNLSPDQWGPWINRDRLWLRNAIDADSSGVFAYEYSSQGAAGGFNNANAQYGLLGLWAAKKSGLNVPNKVWARMDDHWRKDQHPMDKTGAAGWSIGVIHGEHKIDPATALDYHAQVQGPMTAAGAATLSLTERYLYGDKLIDADAADKLPQLRRAIRWLDQHFDLQGDAVGSDWFYYIWTLQRIAQANGIRVLNGIDTFRDITAEVINRQSADGLWRDPAGVQGKLMSTGFALLYLTNAVASPIGISKIEFNGRWNNRPHDIANFVAYASDQYEVNTVWQVVDLTLPVSYLLDSPILYLSTDRKFKLPDVQVQRLREYLDAGGLLVLNPDKPDGGITRSFINLTRQLYPDIPLKEVPRDGPLYSLHETISKKIGMKMIHNGIRPLVIQLIRDIGKGLQTEREGDADGFDVLNNLYLYTVGMNPQRVRLDTPHRSGTLPSTIRQVRAARIDLGSGSDPEPAALEQMRRYMAQEHVIDLQVERVKPTALSSHALAFLTVQPNVTISDDDAKAINQWLEQGGTLWMDAAGGYQDAVDRTAEILLQIRPGSRPIPLAYDSPILTGQGLRGGYDNNRVRYRYFLLQKMGPSNTSRLQTVRIDDRPAIIFSAEDLTTGLAGFSHWRIFGYTPQSARHLVANAILQATR